MEELNWAELLEMNEYGSGFGTAALAEPMMDDVFMGMEPWDFFFAGFAGVGFVLLAIIATMVVSRCFVFKKMGHKWYEALLSGHNLFVLITSAGKPGRWAFAPVLMIIPLVGWVIGGILSLIVWTIVSISLAKKFGKSTGFGVGLILLPFIFYPILAWGNAKYKK